MIKSLLFALAIALGLAVLIVFIFNKPVSALSLMEGVNAAHGAGQPTALFGDTGIITKITNTLLFIAGALAVIMLIFGGIRYTISGGNSSNVTAAKNTVMYAIVGLIISFLAYAAVNFILGTVSSGGQFAPSNL